VKGGADLRSANQSPQSVGSSGMDSGVDSFSDQLGDLPHIAISLCGGLSENREITRGIRRSCDQQYSTIQKVGVSKICFLHF